VIRSALVLVVGAVVTLVLGGWVVVSSLLRLPGTRWCCEAFPRTWARLLLFLSGARVRVEGGERVDWSRPVILVANHQSWFDVFALAAYLPARFRFVAKQELARIPVFGRAWRACGHISVDRGDRGQAIASLEEAGGRIRDERLAVIFFPEGTRSPDGRLRAFKKGAFVLALQTGVPVIPVGIAGSRAIMPKGSFRIRPGEIRVRVGDPLPVEGLTMADRDELVREGRGRVAGLMEDPDALEAGVEGEGGRPGASPGSGVGGGTGAE
jgi:1-acyl-sn-glycerol-3-phosphate acyltransferase